MRGLFYTTRESLIPKGAVKVGDKHSDAVAYLYPSASARSLGKPAMIVFYGQQSKPVARFYYQTDAEREAAVKKWFDARQVHAARKLEHAAERASAVATVKFEVGKTYQDRSSCDYDTIYSFTVVSRTDKQLTFLEYGKMKRRGIYVYNGVEQCKPHGAYSMCTIISADRENAYGKDSISQKTAARTP